MGKTLPQSENRAIFPFRCLVDMLFPVSNPDSILPRAGLFPGQQFSPRPFGRRNDLSHRNQHHHHKKHGARVDRKMELYKYVEKKQKAQVKGKASKQAGKGGKGSTKMKPGQKLGSNINKGKFGPVATESENKDSSDVSIFCFVSCLRLGLPNQPDALRFNDRPG